MADAALSDGSELLLARRDFDDSDNTLDDGQCVNEYASTNINCDEAFQLGQRPENDAYLLKPTESEQDYNNCFVNRRDSSTAYQRQSYDDRQLPPVVSIDREIPWYQHSVTSSILTNNNSQTPEACNTHNNNGLRSPTSSAKSISPTSSSTPNVRKKTHQTSIVTSTNIIEHQQQQQQQRRFSKKASFSGRRGAKMTSSSVDATFFTDPLNDMSCSQPNKDNQHEYSVRKVDSNEPCPDAGKSELGSFIESVNNNISSEKLSDSTQLSGNTSSSSAYRKLSINKKRTSRRESSG